MENKKILLDNIDKIHTTEMGVGRIKRNLKRKNRLNEAPKKEKIQ